MREFCLAAILLAANYSMWAHTAVSLTAICVPDGPMLANRQKSIEHAMGPHDAMRARAYKSLWANSSFSASGSLFTLWAHVSILLGSFPASCGPLQQSQQQPFVYLMGQCWLVVKML